jgi:YfiR/HmsC-like
LHRIILNSAAKMARRARASLKVFVSLSVVPLALGLPTPLRAQPAGEEYKVKAAFIFHFAQLVEWPAGAQDDDLDFCIFDDEPRRQEMQSVLDGKSIGTHALRIRVLSQSQGFQGCNILFLGRYESRRQAATITSLRGLPVLTVGETENFLSDGGMIRFHLDGEKIRFDINLGCADSSHLKISSRLLFLATSVTGGGAERGR